MNKFIGKHFLDKEQYGHIVQEKISSRKHHTALSQAVKNVLVFDNMRQNKN